MFKNGNEAAITSTSRGLRGGAYDECPPILPYFYRLGDAGDGGDTIFEKSRNN